MLRDEGHVTLVASKVQVVLGVTMRAECNCRYEDLVAGQTGWFNWHGGDSEGGGEEYNVGNDPFILTADF